MIPAVSYTSEHSRLWRGLKGHQIAICSLIHFYVHDAPLNEPSPMLSRLLTFTVRLIFQIDKPSPDLSNFLQLLSAALDDEAGDLNASSKWLHSIQRLITSCNTFSGLHNFFTKVERLLMTEELYDEIQNVTIKPAERQIDEQSPFGHFLQRCLDDYLGLEDNEFARLVQDVQIWVSGEAGSAIKNYYEDHAEMRSVSTSLSRGDYALARSELEGFFDRSPNDAIQLSLHEDLYRNAIFHHRTRAYEAAKSSLEEALRLSRGVNDVKCVSSCDKLLRLVEYEETRLKGKLSQLKTPLEPLFSIDELWRIERDLDRGGPLLSILSNIQWLLQPVTGKEIEDEVSLSQLGVIHLWHAQIWARIDRQINAKSCQSLCLKIADEMDLHDWTKVAVPLATVESDYMSDVCDLEKRFKILFNTDMLRSLDMATYEKWQRSAWKLLYSASNGCRDMQDAIRLLNPEIVGELEGKFLEDLLGKEEALEANEATFGIVRQTTLTSSLKGELKEARLIREQGEDYSASLAIAIKVLQSAKKAQLFHLIREAILECAESIFGLGNLTRAKDILEEYMTQLLLESQSSLRGRAAWVYSKILISSFHQGKVELSETLPWLTKARDAFLESNNLDELADVLYVQLSISEHLDRSLEAQEFERDLLSVQKEIASVKMNNQEFFHSFQSLIAQIGARVMAGA